MSAVRSACSGSQIASAILAALSLALVGGVAALWVSGQNMSVPASVGFIALFGVAVLNGLVWVSGAEHLRDDVGRELVGFESSTGPQAD